MNRLFAFVLLILLLPLLLFLGLMISVKLQKPIFRQKRLGKNGDIFVLYKFKTMTNKKDSRGGLLPDKERLILFGQFLRSTGLDELPNLFNILKGEMNFVGPRPLLAEYIGRYSKEQAKRHEVKPGLTGWAQVNGRNAISWEEKFKLDIWYINNQSFWLDTKIVFLTVKKILIGEGVSANNEETMPKFLGNKK